jgi:hypothetical protein
VEPEERSGGGTKGDGVPSVTDTEGFADDEDDSTDDEPTNGAKASGTHRTAIARRRGSYTTAQGRKTITAHGSKAPVRSAASSDEEEEEGNEADEEDNDWDGEDEEDESEESSEREERDAHEGHEELELSLAERDKEGEEEDEAEEP